ncbi:hypothetical protein [Salinimicrobium gaetbulicola]|uniref:VCBS repeat protein n=1 Tax=Salinimicrobium gaetbulicola TaxID=999702 RepID=A0ABW3IFS9_9FLAO
MDFKRYIKTFLILFYLLLLACNSNKKGDDSFKKEVNSDLAETNQEISHKLTNQEINKTNSECSIPEKIRLLGDELKNWSFIEETDLSIYTSDYGPYPKRNCYSFIENDFTNDGKNDFVCIMKDKENGIFQLVAFNNYKSEPKFIVIDGAADYGEYGIGNILYYSNNEGFVSNKLGSGVARITWKNHSYQINYSD